MHDSNQNDHEAGEGFGAGPAACLPGRIMGMLTAGLCGLIAIPVLSILSLVFVLLAVALPLASIANLIGIAYIPFTVLMIHVVGLPQLILALIVGGLFLVAACGCYTGLRRILRHLRAYF